MSTYAIDTAARFGDIPFVEFTRDLVTGVFDSLVEAHMLQMEEYADFVSSLTDDLSTYINNTAGDVDFDQISDFLLAYELPEVDTATLTDLLDNLNPGVQTTAPAADPNDPPVNIEQGDNIPTNDTWWSALISNLAPAVTNLVDKINDPSEQLDYDKLVAYNDALLNGVNVVADQMPTYADINFAISSLIASNKYGLLQTMAKQGMMRLVVTEGEIETKITFSTWNTSSSGSETSDKTKERNRTKSRQKIRYKPTSIFKRKKERKRVKNRTVTVNTAKSYQRDSSGTKVDIFGRVLIKFKTDYAPLNG